MITTSCIQTHILRLQYLQARLAGMYVAEMKTGGCRRDCFANSLIITSKYISTLYCYRAFSTTPEMVLAIDLTSVTNTGEAIVSIENWTIPTSVELQGDTLYVYSYNPASQIGVIIGFFTPVDPDVGVVYEDITTDPCDLISAWNCLSPLQLCAIINHGYSLLNVPEATYGSVLPESIDIHSLNI